MDANAVISLGDKTETSLETQETPPNKMELQVSQYHTSKWND